MKGAASLSSVRFSSSPHSPAQFPPTARLLVAPSVFMAVSTQIRSEGNSKRKPSLSPKYFVKVPMVGWTKGNATAPPEHRPLLPPANGGNPSIGNSSSRAGRWWWWWSRNVAIPFFSRRSRQVSPAPLARSSGTRARKGGCARDGLGSNNAARPPRWPASALLCVNSLNEL